MNLHILAERCDNIARANGFDVPTWDNIPIKIMMAITELDEARDGVHGIGADPFAEELADTAIRILSILKGVFRGVWNDRVSLRALSEREVFLSAVEIVLWPTLGYLCKAVEYWRHGLKSDTRVSLELALMELFRLADKCGIDLFAEIDAKCAKNEGREHLHGKARSEA